MPHRARRRWFKMALVVVGAAGLAGRQAHAWQQEHDGEAGCGVRWRLQSIPFTTQWQGTQPLTEPALRTALAQAMAAWQDVQCGVCAAEGATCPSACPAHPLAVAWQDAGIGKGPVHLPCADSPADGCAHGDPVGLSVRFLGDGVDWPLGQAVVGYTLLTWRQGTGEILGADLQVRTSAATACVEACGTGQHDVQNTVTHELGHVLGLRHSGDPEATMAATSHDGETEKRTLALDDRLAVCAAYAVTCSAPACPELTATDDPASAPAVTTSGCSAGRAPGGWLPLAVTALGLMACRWWSRCTTSCRSRSRRR